MRTLFSSTETQRQEPGEVQATPRLLPRRSAWLFGWFRAYARRYVRRHFHAVRVSREGASPSAIFRGVAYAPSPPLPPLHKEGKRKPRATPSSPPCEGGVTGGVLRQRPSHVRNPSEHRATLPASAVIVVLNHPSWWDPMIGFVLTDLMPASRFHFAPIEAMGLAQYPFLERLGFFGVEVGTTRGSMAFLRRSKAILSRPESVLWITAQGEFVDPRERPTRLKEGVGHMIHRLSAATIVPLALEYPFWNDRCPEALARFGDPISVSSGRERSPAAWTAHVEQALRDTQDHLAEEARRRDPAAFITILGGTAGVGGIYDLWRRLRARIHGKPFMPEHQMREQILGAGPRK